MSPIRIPTVKILPGLIRKAMSIVGLQPKIDKRLCGKEQVFLAPPLTPALIAAIKQISPQFDLKVDEKSREFWQRDQNGSCWGEFEALEPVFTTMAQPKRILEIGPGLGRSLVFFSKKLSWEDCEIHAFEGEGADRPRYTRMGKRGDDSYCGNLAMLRHVLLYNKIKNVEIFNALATPLAELPGPYDFIYSFYAVGFHWSLEHFVDDLILLMSDTTVGVFSVPDNFTPFARLETFHYKILVCQAVWPVNQKLKILVLSKHNLSWLGNPDEDSQADG